MWRRSDHFIGTGEGLPVAFTSSPVDLLSVRGLSTAADTHRDQRGRQHLVGDVFTRAEVTAANMLLLVNPPPDELFLFPASMRLMYTTPLTSNSAFAPYLPGGTRHIESTEARQ
jgi:hypothetical protein